MKGAGFSGRPRVRRTLRAGEQALAPTLQEIAVAVEHDHRMGPAVEDIDAVLAVDGDGSDIGQLPAVGQLGPAFDDAIAVLARAENGGHVVSLLFFLSSPSFRGSRSENPE